MADVIAPADAPKPRPEKFNEAAKQPEPPKEPQRPSVDSEQVKNTQLGLQGGPPPSPGMKNAAAAQAHNAAMAKDDKASKQATADYQAKLEKAKQLNGKTKKEREFYENHVSMRHDKDKGNDQGR